MELPANIQSVLIETFFVVYSEPTFQILKIKSLKNEID